MRYLVVLESPYRGDKKKHKAYLQRALRDSVEKHNEAPVASHQLFTDAYDDNNPAQRHLGIELQKCFILQSTCVVVYVDYGISSGMEQGIEFAKKEGVPIIFREIGRNPE